jgi:hypothetical protein
LQNSKGLPSSDVIINYTPGLDINDSLYNNNFIGFNKNADE